MPKTLVLVRHGKSSWRHNLSDDKRPLKKRAFSDIKLVASTFKHCLDQTFTFKTSYAVRAHSTASLFLNAFNISEDKLNIETALYTFDINNLKDFLYNIDDKIEKLMLFGHNPAFTQLANDFGNEYFDNIPTSGLVLINFENSSWKELTKGKTILHLFPKNLK